jgi:peptidoglycan/xylan/chitin deacetylase (PgdA/CDA1 family)
MPARLLKNWLYQQGAHAKKHLQHLNPVGAVLMYHRVTRLEADPWGLAVTPEHFEQHLQVLQRYNCVMPIEQLAQARSRGELPSGSVAITFDDGYVDNLLYAKPLLEKYDLPAMVYISSACVDQQREFWWDELEKVLLLPEQLPEQLNLTIRGQQHCFDLGPAANYTADQRLRDRKVCVWKADPASRLGFYFQVWRRIQPLFPQEQAEVLDQLLAWGGLDCSIRASHRTLTLEELRQLDQGDCVQIGGHTVHHPNLPSHTAAIQLQEILDGKQQLEALLGHEIRSFSYPFGAYNRETIQQVQQAGFDHALSTVEEPVWWGSNSFSLPRFTVYNWDGDTFERQLNAWLEKPALLRMPMPAATPGQLEAS